MPLWSVLGTAAETERRAVASRFGAKTNRLTLRFWRAGFFPCGNEANGNLAGGIEHQTDNLAGLDFDAHRGGAADGDALANADVQLQHRRSVRVGAVGFALGGA
jgi:hypothetical protein